MQMKSSKTVIKLFKQLGKGDFFITLEILMAWEWIFFNYPKLVANALKLKWRHVTSKCVQSVNNGGHYLQTILIRKKYKKCYKGSKETVSTWNFHK